jgi:hypothetical protein
MDQHQRQRSSPNYLNPSVLRMLFPELSLLTDSKFRDYGGEFA